MNRVPAPAGASVSASLALTAELDGDYREDTIVLCDGWLGIFYGVGSFSSVNLVDVPGGAVSFAVMPGQGNEGRDAIVTVGPGGVLLWKYDIDSDRFTSTDLALSGWSDMQHVIAGAIENDGAWDDLAGIDGDGRVVRVAGNVTSTPLIYPTITNTERFFDLAFLDALGDPQGHLELAMLQESNILVLGTSGIPVAHPIDLLLTGKLAVLRSGVAGQDRLAVAALRQGLSGYSVCVVDQTTTEAWVPLGLDDVAGITSADFSLDGEDDLILSHEGGTGLLLLTADSSAATTFSTPDMQADFIAFDVASPASRGVPLLADVDADGLPDLLYPRWENGENALWVYSHGAQAQGAGEIVIDSSWLEAANSTDTIFNDKIRFILPAASPGLPYLESIVWRYPWQGNTVERFATRREVLKGVNWGGVIEIYFTLDDFFNGSFPTIVSPQKPATYVPHPPNHSMTGDVFFLEVRAVDEGVTGKVTAAGPSIFVGHFSLKDQKWEPDDVLNTYWPEVYTDYVLGIGEHHLSIRDAGAEADYQAMRLLSLQSRLYDSREFEPGDIPLPGLPPMQGGPPQSSGAPGPVLPPITPK